MMSNINTKFYAPELDGLRFVAALLVFIHHAPQISFLAPIKSYGWVGVDLFLTISAFLITKLILLEYEKKGFFDIRAFFIRRALRIWPLFFLYTTIMCIFSVIFLEFHLKTVAAWWLSHLSFTGNIMTAIHGYSPIPFTAHLWTISLEEQAYIIMPLFITIFLVSGARPKLAFWFCIGMVSILILARTALVLNSTPHPFIWVLPLRADAFIFGALAAILVRQPLKSGILAFALAGVLLLSLLLFRNIDVSGPGQVFGYTLVALGCLSVLLGAQAKGLANVLLGNPVARYLGKISYGIYVFHLVAIGIAEKLQIGALPTFIFALGVTIAISAVSYVVLERPFLIIKERFARIESRPI